MAINKDIIPFAVVGIAAAALFGYYAHLSVDVETYPDVEIAAGGGFDHGAPIGNMAPSEYSRPANSLVPVTTMRHRYPTNPGGNITCLIHHGLSPLRQSKGMDQRWITRPPAEVMW
jgi:hypothetical protein